MSNKARHILPTVNGKAITDGDVFERLLGAHLVWFETLWASELQFNGLLNAKRGLFWYGRDQLHVEIPGARLDETDERAEACVDEYARLRPIPVKKHNATFEHDLHNHLRQVLNNSLTSYGK